jgi:hypothetical protein
VTAAVLIVGIGIGLLLAASLDRSDRRHRHPHRGEAAARHQPPGVGDVRPAHTFYDHERHGA